MILFPGRSKVTDVLRSMPDDVRSSGRLASWPTPNGRLAARQPQAVGLLLYIRHGQDLAGVRRFDSRAVRSIEMHQTRWR